MANENGEKRYNYLDAFRTDPYAERRGLTPIVFDWNRVSEVSILREIEGWENSPMGLKSKSLGLRVHKYEVQCPNPDHDVFRMLLPDEPKPWSYKCYHCITDEMNRVMNERFRRDEEERRLRG